MDQSIYREKNLQRVNSPEQLDACLKVVTPSLWMVLLAIAILVAAALVWGMLGTVETRVSGEAVSDGSRITCTLSAEQAGSVEAGMTARIEGQEMTVERIDTAGSDRIITLKGSLPAGSYDLQIIIETVKPITYLIN